MKVKVTFLGIITSGHYPSHRRHLADANYGQTLISVFSVNITFSYQFYVARQ